MQLEESLVAAAREGRRVGGKRGSLRTWVQIELQARALARVIHALGFQIHDAAQLREKHMRGAFEKLSAELCAGSLQNYARTARLVLRGAEKTNAADRLTNAELGLPERCRDGTKTALSQATLQGVRDGLAQMRDRDRAARLAAIIDLGRLAGLRIQEALLSPASFKSWHKTLDRDGRIDVEFGTKGGRPRWTNIPEEDRPALREAIGRAQALLVEGRLWLAGTKLRGSLDSLGKALRKLGLKGDQSFHSLRYAAARRRLHSYAEDFSEAAALAKVSRDLGHGDGRGRYVRQVYLK